MTDTSPVPGDGPTERERLIREVAQAMHACTSHPDYPDYDEQPCCGTPGPALANPTRYHHEMDHEKGSRGVCWACEPSAATVVDQVLLPLLAARTPAPSAAQAQVNAVRKVLDGSAHSDECESDFTTGAWDCVCPLNDLYAALDAAPTDPGTRDVVVRVYDHEPGPEVTEVERSDGLVLQRTKTGWAVSPMFPSLEWTNWQRRDSMHPCSMHPVGWRARLRTPGTEKTGHA